MPTNINFDKKLGITGVTGISLPSTPPSFQDIYSYQFDGVDDYIDCGDNDNLSFGDSVSDSPFSISAWVKMTDATKFRIAFKSDNSATNNEYGLFTSGTDQLFFQLYDETTSIKIAKFYTTALTSYEGQWIHIVGTYNGNSNISGIKLYLNGIRVDNSGSSLGGYTAMHNTNAPLEIGKYTTTNANGLIDEVAIFNSELSASDITSIYNNGVPQSLESFNPISWWRMGESASWDGSNWTLTDQGSGGNNATTQNMAEASRVLDVPPNPFANTKSILLDGIDDRIECSSLTAYDNSDFSVSIWVKKTTSGLEYVISNSSASAKAGFDIIINSLNVNFQRRTTTKQAATGYINIGFTYNTWHNLIGTYNDTTDDLKLYLDGVLKNTSTASADVNSASVDLRIGCSAVNSLFFQGGIDEVSIFNTELSASDITTIYNSGVPNDISSLSPVSWWRCGDEDTAPTLTDNGSGGNDGTMNNFSTFSTDVPT